MKLLHIFFIVIMTMLTIGPSRSYADDDLKTKNMPKYGSGEKGWFFFEDPAKPNSGSGSGIGVGPSNIPPGTGFMWDLPECMKELWNKKMVAIQSTVRENALQPNKNSDKSATPNLAMSNIEAANIKDGQIWLYRAKPDVQVLVVNANFFKKEDKVVIALSPVSTQAASQALKISADKFYCSFKNTGQGEEPPEIFKDANVLKKLQDYQ